MYIETNLHTLHPRFLHFGVFIAIFRFSSTNLGSRRVRDQNDDAKDLKVGENARMEGTRWARS